MCRQAAIFGFYRPAIFHGADPFLPALTIGSMVKVIPGFSTRWFHGSHSAAPAVLHGSRDHTVSAIFTNDGEAFCFDKFLIAAPISRRLMPGFTMRSARYGFLA